jgi:GABA(A) receptor-associated protein
MKGLELELFLYFCIFVFLYIYINYIKLYINIKYIVIYYPTATIFTIMPSAYKKNTPLEERKIKSQKLKELYPNRIPVIVEMSSSSASFSKFMEQKHKVKYLVPNELCMGQFVKILRDKMKINESTALFFFINNKLFPMTSPLSVLYQEYADEDGFLYIEFCEENTFG